MAFWWAQWSFRDVSWTFLSFSLLLSGPGILYVQASTLVTTDPASVASWKEHFYESRLWFFASFIAVSIVATIALGFLRDGDPSAAIRAGVVQTAIGIIGLISRSERVHAVLVLASTVLLLVGVLLFAFSPDSIY